FIYTVLTAGIVLCFITLLGHFAVETANVYALSIYIFLVVLLLILQGGACSFVISKKNWEDYVPKDPTGRFNQLKDFVKGNIYICGCVGVVAIVAQALTIILAFILQTLGPDPSRHPENNGGYHPFKVDVNQSFLVPSCSVPNTHPESRLSWSDVNRMATHQYGIEEVNLSSSQVDQRISNGSNNSKRPNGLAQGSSLRPTFLPREKAIPEEEARPIGRRNIAVSYEEYVAMSREIHDVISHAEFMGLDRGRSRPEPKHAMPQREVQNVLGKMSFSTFDVSTKGTTMAWIQKFNTYLSLKPMVEEDAIKFSTLHLEGIAHEWWFHGLVTQGHSEVDAYDEFCQRFIDWFDRVDPEVHFCELAHLSQQGNVEEYVANFKRLSVMIIDASERKLIVLFVEGLMEPLKGLVCAFDPFSIQEVIKKALDLEDGDNIVDEARNNDVMEEEDTKKPEESHGEHLQHLDIVLENLEQQSLYAKKSKCEFGMDEILFLGHVVNARGVHVDQSKIQAIMNWPTPTNITHLKRFFGLCSYYWKFAKGFSQIVAPLTSLMKKDAFIWSKSDHVAFEELKKVMRSCLVLVVPDFYKPFMLTCDVSSKGIGVVSMQNQHHIAFESRKLKDHEKKFSIYDK
ncbi:hypothetical protein KI387_012587, partial [Taxus chinensis]